jgi:hypothetical protein
LGFSCFFEQKKQLSGWREILAGPKIAGIETSLLELMMKKSVASLALTGLISLASLGSANSAVLFTNSMITADLTSTNISSAVLGGPVEYSPGIFAFELERGGVSPVWGSATANLVAGSNNSSTTSAAWTLTAGAGYQITSMYLSAGGNYAVTGAGSVTHSLSLTDGATTVISSNILSGAPGGSWFDATQGISYLSGVSSVNATLGVKLTAARNGGFGNSSATFGLDDGGFIGVGAFNNQLGFEAYLGPTLFVQVSPVPEPGEWAMMLAGLGVVSMIARRRRK